jgi:hypothetical protein
VAVGAIAVLSILALGATSSVLQELKLAKFVTESDTSPYLARSAVDIMKVLLSNDATPQAVTLYDLRSREIPLGDKALLIIPVDEQSKINLDLAPKEILGRMPGLSGQTQLIDAVFGANIVAYEELLLLDGMTQEIYAQLKGLTTVFGLGLVNINTAQPDVFGAQGMDSDLITKIQEYRAGDDGIEATEDDRYFSNPSEIIPQLASYGINPVQQQVIQNLLSTMQLGTTTDYVSFDITVLQGKKKVRFFKITVNLVKGTIVFWHEE